MKNTNKNKDAAVHRTNDAIKNSILLLAEQELKHAFKTGNSAMVASIAELIKNIT